MCTASPSTVGTVIIHMNPLIFDAILGTDVGDLCLNMNGAISYCVSVWLVYPRTYLASSIQYIFPLYFF